MRLGALQVRLAADVYAPGGTFDADAVLARLEGESARARSDGFAGMRVAAEMSWAIEMISGPRDLAEYEYRANDLFEREPLTAICLDDRRRFPPGSPSPGGAHGLHLRPDPAEPRYAMSVRITETVDPHGIRLEGEVDFATSAALATALTRLVDAADGDAHVDCSGLRFIDVGGARLLARAARQLSPARSLVLGAPTRPVRRLLAALGGRADVGVVVEEEAGR